MSRNQAKNTCSNMRHTRLDCVIYTTSVLTMQGVTKLSKNSGMPQQNNHKYNLVLYASCLSMCFQLVFGPSQQIFDVFLTCLRSFFAWFGRLLHALYTCSVNHTHQLCMLLEVVYHFSLCYVHFIMFLGLFYHVRPQAYQNMDKSFLKSTQKHA